MRDPIVVSGNDDVLTGAQVIEQDDKQPDDTGPAHPQQGSTLKELGERNRELKGQLEELRKELHDIDKRCAQTEGLVSHNRRHASFAFNQAKRWEEQLSKEMEKNRNAEMEQNAELGGLNEYMVIHDKIDGSSIVSHLSEINGLVEQLASELLSRWTVPNSRPSTTFLGNVKGGLERLIGIRLASLICECDIRHESALTILQFAFQAALSISVRDLYKGSSSTQKGHFISNLSGQVREGEIWSMYGRWRSITHRYLRQLQGAKHTSDCLSFFIKAATDNIYAIALAFGLPLDHEALRRLENDYQSLLIDIGTKTTRLALALTEGVISTDYDLYLPQGADFDRSLMELPFSLPDTPISGEVIAVLSPGMIYVRRHDRQGPLQHVLFREAKVLTELCLVELMKPTETKVEQAKQSKGLQVDQ